MLASLVFVDVMVRVVWRPVVDEAHQDWGHLLPLRGGS